MIGNVREWCEDLWHDNYAEKPDNIKNNGNTAWPSGDEYDCYIIRGGSWQGVSDNCCSASRDRCYPHFKVCVFGFRLALGSL
jgi:formylglycine-generating enzyme required for sulfatase activity